MIIAFNKKVEARALVSWLQIDK